MQKSPPADMPGRFYQVSLRMRSKSVRRKPAKHKKTPREKISQRRSIVLYGENKLEAKKRSSASEKGLQLRKVITAPVINYLP